MKKGDWYKSILQIPSCLRKRATSPQTPSRVLQATAIEVGIFHNEKPWMACKPQPSAPTLAAKYCVLLLGHHPYCRCFACCFPWVMHASNGLLSGNLYMNLIRLEKLIVVVQWWWKTSHDYGDLVLVIEQAVELPNRV